MAAGAVRAVECLLSDLGADPHASAVGVSPYDLVVALAGDQPPPPSEEADDEEPDGSVAAVGGAWSPFGPLSEDTAVRLLLVFAKFLHPEEDVVGAAVQAAGAAGAAMEEVVPMGSAAAGAAATTPSELGGWRPGGELSVSGGGPAAGLGAAVAVAAGGQQAQGTKAATAQRPQPQLQQPQQLPQQDLAKGGAGPSKPPASRPPLPQTHSPAASGAGPSRPPPPPPSSSTTATYALTSAAFGSSGSGRAPQSEKLADLRPPQPQPPQPPRPPPSHTQKQVSYISDRLRGQNLERLEDKSDDLRHQAGVFQRKGRALKKKTSLWDALKGLVGGTKKPALPPASSPTSLRKGGATSSMPSPLPPRGGMLSSQGVSPAFAAAASAMAKAAAARAAARAERGDDADVDSDFERLKRDNRESLQELERQKEGEQEQERGPALGSAAVLGPGSEGQPAAEEDFAISQQQEGWGGGGASGPLMQSVVRPPAPQPRPPPAASSASLAEPRSRRGKAQHNESHVHKEESKAAAVEDADEEDAVGAQWRALQAESAADSRVVSHAAAAAAATSAPAAAVPPLEQRASASLRMPDDVQAAEDEEEEGEEGGVVASKGTYYKPRKMAAMRAKKKTAPQPEMAALDDEAAVSLPAPEPVESPTGLLVARDEASPPLRGRRRRSFARASLSEEEREARTGGPPASMGITAAAAATAAATAAAPSEEGDESSHRSGRRLMSLATYDAQDGLEEQSFGTAGSAATAGGAAAGGGAAPAADVSVAEHEQIESYYRERLDAEDASAKASGLTGDDGSSSVGARFRSAVTSVMGAFSRGGRRRRGAAGPPRAMKLMAAAPSDDDDYGGMWSGSAPKARDRDRDSGRDGVRLDVPVGSAAPQLGSDDSGGGGGAGLEGEEVRMSTQRLASGMASLSLAANIGREEEEQEEEGGGEPTFAAVAAASAFELGMARICSGMGDAALAAGAAAAPLQQQQQQQQQIQQQMGPSFNAIQPTPAFRPSIPVPAPAAPVPAPLAAPARLPPPPPTGAAQHLRERYGEEGALAAPAPIAAGSLPPLPPPLPGAAAGAAAGTGASPFAMMGAKRAAVPPSPFAMSLQPAQAAAVGMPVQLPPFPGSTASAAAAAAPAPAPAAAGSAAAASPHVNLFMVQPPVPPRAAAPLDVAAPAGASPFAGYAAQPAGASPFSSAVAAAQPPAQQAYAHTPQPPQPRPTGGAATAVSPLNSPWGASTLNRAILRGPQRVVEMLLQTLPPRHAVVRLVPSAAAPAPGGARAGAAGGGAGGGGGGGGGGQPQLRAVVEYLGKELEGLVSVGLRAACRVAQGSGPVWFVLRYVQDAAVSHAGLHAACIELAHMVVCAFAPADADGECAEQPRRGAGTPPGAAVAGSRRHPRQRGPTRLRPPSHPRQPGPLQPLHAQPFRRRRSQRLLRLRRPRARPARLRLRRWVRLLPEPRRVNGRRGRRGYHPCVGSDGGIGHAAVGGPGTAGAGTSSGGGAGATGSGSRSGGR